MNRQIIQLDVTDIDEAGWAWSISSPVVGHFTAYVHFVDYSSPDWDATPEPRCASGWGDTPQAALDSAYRNGVDLHCAICHDLLGDSNGDCCSIECEVEREARKVLA